MKKIPNNPAPQYNPKAPYVISTHAEGGFLQPKDAWDTLSMAEKSEMMKVAIKNGIYDLSTIRKKYNEFAEGGDTDTDWSYDNWKRLVTEYMGIRPDEDNTYDYEAYFNKYPEEAWKMLKGDPTAHFSDEFKTVYHPTFSSKSIGNDGSIYSGVRNSKTNPQGLVGGTWSPDYHTFTMSSDGYRGPVSMDDRKWYLENAEDDGVVLREANGSLPVYDGIPWGGVLPNIIINGSRRGRKFEDGGFTSELDWSPDSWFSKRVAKPDGTLYNDEEAARLASHVPEYNNIEQTAKANGTWLKMSDGSIWKGDPRSWVMMQSESYKKNYSPKPWYTGQAEWPTTFDYGKGKVDTNKVTRAPYYNNQMWFSDSEDYGQTFADYQNSTGLGWRFDTPGEEDIKGHNFLSAIPKEGNYRTLESPANGRPDQWQRLPFVLEDGTINRLPESQISVDSKGRNIRADKQKVLTDDVVNWSKDLGDQGIFMQNIDDGAIIKNGEILRQPVNEFISQPGFTDKVKFIEGNTGDFDIDNPYKYANNFYNEDTSLDNNYAALGGPIFRAANQFKGGGYTSSDSIRKRIAKHEGAAMTGAKDPLSGKFLKNRSFESEDRSFYRALPESIRDKVLANQELADNLYSYSYNVGAGNFKKRVVPTLEKFYQGKAMIKDIEDSMWASGDSKLRGLRIRRAQEREGVRNALSPKVPDLVVQPVSTAVFNPYIPQAENTVIAPVMVPDEDSYITAHKLTEAEERKQKFQERMEAINNFNRLLQMTSLDNTAVPSFMPTTGNVFLDSMMGLTKAEGGSIYIKPSHRGRLTELKERTGKTEAELYNDGNPAHKKMVVFARSARKWKHGLGGNLFSGEENHSQQMITTGGAGYVPPTNSNIEKVLIDGSKEIMSIIQNANMDGDGVPQDTYLLPRNIQRNQFLKKGYIEGNKGDYGLVKKAVGNRSIPIYQRNPDAISRDKLIVLGNTYSPMFDTKHSLEHPGSAPTAVYTDGHGKYYQKQWDLNDYGGDGGSTAGIAGKLLDFVGSPTVVTTGFQEINDKTHPWFGYIMKNIMKSKGLVPTEIDGETKFTLPEITVSGKKKKAFGGNLFDGTTEDSQKMQVGLRVTNDWKPFTLGDVLANAARIEQQKQAMEDRLNNVFTLSNDATSVANGKPQNRHLERKTVEGAKAHRAWEEEHPVATFAGNVLGAIPLAIAAIPAAGAWELQ